MPPDLQNLTDIRSKAKGLKVVYISLYCYNSFPIRIFHRLSLNASVDSHTFFLKDSYANLHSPLSQSELDLLAGAIEEIDPDLIAISILAPYVDTAQKVVARLRTVSQAPIVGGGKFPTVNPAGALEFLDYACRGEGELALLEAFSRLGDGKDLSGVKGLWRHDADGNLVDGGMQRLIQDLDAIPTPAVALPGMYFIENDSLTKQDPLAVHPVIMVMASRGCVYQCTFCVNSLLAPMNRGNGKFVRIRTPESIVDEIEKRVALIPPESRKSTIIHFLDEVFGVIPDWTVKFTKLYKSRVGLPFLCEMVPKLIKEKNIRPLADAGLRKLNFGIQSGADEVRNDIFHRPGKNDELLEKARILARCGVEATYDIILENPFETPDMMKSAIRLLLDLPHPIKMNVYKLQYFPDYPLTKEALKRGFVKPEDLTHEKIAAITMNNWAFKPHASTRDRKMQFQNAVFLLGWADNGLNRLLCRMFTAAPIRPLALAIGFLAAFFYRVETENGSIYVWLRRARGVLSLIRSGRYSELVFRTSKLFRSLAARVRPPHSLRQR